MRHTLYFCCTLLLLFFTAAVFATNYTFAGDSNWTDPNNWSDSLIPPATLPNGTLINKQTFGNQGVVSVNNGGIVNNQQGANNQIHQTVNA